MTDQPSSAEAGQASVDPAIADYFQVEATPAKSAAEQVPSSGEEEKTTVAEKSKETPSEEKNDGKSKSDDEPKETEEKKTTPAKKDEGQDAKDKKEEKDGAQLPTEFEVGGRKYKSLDKAIEAVNKINGNNTELVGDNRKLKEANGDLEDKVKTLSAKIEELVSANQEWQRYYDGEGEKPETKLDVDGLVEEKLNAREKKKAEKELASKYEKEFDEIFQEDDFADVQPIFKKMLDEYEGIPKVSPKTVYARARREYKSSLKGDKPEEDEDYQKAVEEGIKKALAKREASKENPASGGSNGKTLEQNLDPAIADYFKNR